MKSRHKYQHTIVLIERGNIHHCHGDLLEVIFEVPHVSERLCTEYNSNPGAQLVLHRQKITQITNKNSFCEVLLYRYRITKNTQMFTTQKARYVPMNTWKYKHIHICASAQLDHRNERTKDFILIYGCDWERGSV